MNIVKYFTLVALAAAAIGVSACAKKETPPPPVDQRWGAFLSGTGEWVNVDGTNDAKGYNLESGGFTLGVGAVLLSLGRSAGTDAERRKCFRWSAYFLAMGAVQLSGGCLDAIVARSASPRT